MKTPSVENFAIAAVATALGGGIVIIRMSGKDVKNIASAIWRSKIPFHQIPKRTLVLGDVVSSKGGC